ncbi:hypothetical protein [Microbacterium sp. NPDC055599]
MFPNGRVPQDRLITFASGWLPNEGTWYHQLPPATYAKHLSLVALAKRNTGRVLKPSEGWSCYRPYDVQVYAKRVHGIWAATPGTSSHGMFWERIECAAIDYGNWSYVYNGNRGNFYRDVRAVGLEPGLISTVRGYPDEPWHVVDKRPWAAGAATGGGAVPFAPTLTFEEDGDMRFVYVRDNIDGNDVGGWGLLNPGWRKDSRNARPYLTIRENEPDAQVRANRWAEVWGNARVVSRQAWLDSIDAVVKTG